MGRGNSGRRGNVSSTPYLFFQSLLNAAVAIRGPLQVWYGRPLLRTALFHARWTPFQNSVWPCLGTPTRFSTSRSSRSCRLVIVFFFARPSSSRINRNPCANTGSVTACGWRMVIVAERRLSPQPWLISILQFRGRRSNGVPVNTCATHRATSHPVPADMDSVTF
jgi:hypothetical protein